MTRQFENEANADTHSRTTAREILADFEESAWTTGSPAMAPGGTLKASPGCWPRSGPKRRSSSVSPEGRAIAGEQRAPGLQPRRGTPAASLHRPGSHASDAGLDPGFHSQADRRCRGHGGDFGGRRHPWPRRCAPSRELAVKEGIFVGITSGATFAGALHIASKAPKGSVVLCMLPDTGERYLSTPMFADVGADMTEEELAISRSTPSCQLA